MKKLNPLFSLAAAFALSLAFGVTAQAADKLIVGASPTPHAEILENIKPMLAKQGVELEVRVFTDYVQPNVQLSEKRIDANFFQHKPFMNEFNRTRGTDIQAVADVFIAPFGAYCSKVTKIADLKEGAVVAIPNDAVNGGRALQLLHQAGVIQLSDPNNNMATEKDIVGNPKKIKIKQLEAPMLPRVLGEVDLDVINTTFALEAKLNPNKDALFLEGSKSLFINLLAARPDNKDSPAMQKLVAALRSPESKQFILDRFKGSLVPVF
jgi:D-methionine transport system substrate-binding protein